MMTDMNKVNTKILKNFQSQVLGSVQVYIAQLKTLGFTGSEIVAKIEEFLKEVQK